MRNLTISVRKGLRSPQLKGLGRPQALRRSQPSTGQSRAARPRQPAPRQPSGALTKKTSLGGRGVRNGHVPEKQGVRSQGPCGMAAGLQAHPTEMRLGQPGQWGIADRKFSLHWGWEPQGDLIYAAPAEGLGSPA